MFSVSPSKQIALGHDSASSKLRKFILHPYLTVYIILSEIRAFRFLTVVLLKILNGYSVTLEAKVRNQSSPCGIFGGEGVTGTEFSPSISMFPCQCHSTNASYSFINLSLVLNNIGSCERR